jgi:ferrous iron transport protein B
VGALMYFAGIVIILLCALLINQLTGYKNRKSFFIMELPEYKRPSLWGACKSMLARGWAYIVKAGTIILICNFVVHVMQTFNWSFEVVDASQSILHDIATPFAYVIAPVVGICAWQLAAASVTGFIAKENVVGTLAVCFAITNFINVDDLALVGGATQVAQIMNLTKVSALSYLMFNLFSPPCFAAIGAMNSEIKSKKWLWAGIGLQFAVGYSVGFLVFFFGTLFTGAGFGSIWMPIVGWTFVVAIGILFTVLIIKKNKQLKKEYAFKA